MTIDLYYQHKDDADVPLADSLGAFDALAKAGKIRAIGLSQFHRRRGSTKRCSVGGDAGLTGAVRPADLVQSGRARQARRRAARRGAGSTACGILPFYSLANGFLTGKYRSKDDLGKSRRAGFATSNISKDAGRDVLAALDEVAAETGAALATVALAWTMAQPGITAPIASATSLDQLNELMAALTLELYARPDRAAERSERLALLQHVQRCEGQRLGRGGDDRFGFGRPEGAVQRRQLRRVAARPRPIWPGACRRPRRSGFPSILSASQKRLKSSPHHYGRVLALRAPARNAR